MVLDQLQEWSCIYGTYIIRKAFDGTFDNVLNLEG
jgi:hypothetical protein